MKFVITFSRVEQPAGIDTEAPAKNRMQWRWDMRARGLLVAESFRGFDDRGAAIRNCVAVTGFEVETPLGAPVTFSVERER